MKLLIKVGDALLAKVVPGIDVKAGCGRCQRAGYSCGICCGGSAYRNMKWVYFYDSCGNYCYRRCQQGGLECLDRPAGPC
jgi:hypothetical protein